MRYTVKDAPSLSQSCPPHQALSTESAPHTEAAPAGLVRAECKHQLRSSTCEWRRVVGCVWGGVGSVRDTNGDINTPWSRSEEEVVTTKVALPAREDKSWSVHTG